MESIEVGAEGWTARLPAGWRVSDRIKPNYVEAPDGSAGAYFLHALIPGEDLVATTRELHEVELDRLPGGREAWEILEEEEVSSDERVELVAKLHHRSAGHLLCSRILGAGRTLIRMTFHDYDCRDPEDSRHAPDRWLASLRLDPEARQ